MQLGQGSSVVDEVLRAERAVEGWTRRGAGGAHVERNEPACIDVALRERNEVLDGEVVDGDLEVCRSFLREQTIHEDPAVAIVAQLEALDVYASRSPMDSGRLCARPERRVESQPEIIQAELIAILVEDEIRVRGIVVLCILMDLHCEGTQRFLVVHLQLHAVEIEARRS